LISAPGMGRAAERARNQSSVLAWSHLRTDSEVSAERRPVRRLSTMISASRSGQWMCRLPDFNFQVHRIQPRFSENGWHRILRPGSWRQGTRCTAGIADDAGPRVHALLEFVAREGRVAFSGTFEDAFRFGEGHAARALAEIVFSSQRDGEDRTLAGGRHGR
jgi:hypothetical protein